VSKPDQVGAAAAIALLLEQPDLLPALPHRIAAVYLLYEQYKGETLATNPLTSVYVASPFPVCQTVMSMALVASRTFPSVQQ
jgi:hypothetical protein